MGKKPKKVPSAFDEAWCRLAPLLQLDLFEKKEDVANAALAELRALEQRLKGDRAKRPA